MLRLLFSRVISLCPRHGITGAHPEGVDAEFSLGFDIHARQGCGCSCSLPFLPSVHHGAEQARAHGSDQFMLRHFADTRLAVFSQAQGHHI